MSTTRTPPDQPRPDAAAQRRAVRQTLLVMAGMVILAVCAVVLGTALSRDDDAGSPAGTVRSFLIDAAVDQNGVVACRFLTADAVRRLAAVEPPETSCEGALLYSRLTLGGRLIDRESGVKRLSYRVDQRGARAWVTVRDHGAARTFGLRRATASELDESFPPPTPWRIDSGVNELLGS